MSLETECLKWFKFIGIHNGSNVTVHTGLFYIAALTNLAFMIYKLLFTKLENELVVMHSICLWIFYTGIFAAMNHRGIDVTHIGHLVEHLVGLTHPKFKSDYDNLLNNRYRSAVGKTFVVIGRIDLFMIFYVNFEQLIKSVLGAKLELQFGGTESDTVLYIFAYSLQFSLVVIGGLGIYIQIQTLWIIHLHLLAKFDLLNKTLSELSLSTNSLAELRLTVKQCAQHHQHTLEVFKAYKDVWTENLKIVYYGVVSAIYVSRGMLYGEKQDLGFAPKLFGETAYVWFCCFNFSQLEFESMKVRLSAYSSDWTGFPKDVKSSLRIITSGSSQPLTVPFFSGGPNVSLDTFLKIANATFVYIVLGLFAKFAF